jgi:hypothetical protein
LAAASELANSAWHLRTSPVASTASGERNAGHPSPLEFLFLFAVFFPYVQVFPIGTDVQPVCLCLAVFSLTCSHRWMMAPRPIWSLGLLLFVAVCIFLIGERDFAALRSVGDYTSLFLIALASYGCSPQLRLWTIRLLKATIWGWFIVGLIQSVYVSDFLYTLLPDVRRTASRGVVSLAPEPGYYATMCLFFLLTLFLYNRERSIYGLLCLGGHLKTGHTWTLQNWPTERNQNKTIYTLREGTWANIL